MDRLTERLEMAPPTNRKSLGRGRTKARRTTGSTEDVERQRALEKELRRIVTHVRNAGKAECVILFGSLASGKVHETSDLDVVVIQKSRQAFWGRVLKLRRELNPRTGLDLLVYTPEEFKTLLRERPFFRDEIVGKGRVVYERA